MSTHDPYAKGDRGIKKICTNSYMQQNTSKGLVATCHELVEGSLTLYSVLLDKKNWTSQKILNMVTSGKAKNHYIQRTTTKTILSKHQRRLGSSSGMMHDKDNTNVGCTLITSTMGQETCSCASHNTMYEQTTLKNKHWNKPCHHCNWSPSHRSLNNGRKMEICKKHQTIKMSRQNF